MMKSTYVKKKKISQILKKILLVIQITLFIEKSLKIQKKLIQNPKKQTLLQILNDQSYLTDERTIVTKKRTGLIKKFQKSLKVFKKYLQIIPAENNFIILLDLQFLCLVFGEIFLIPINLCFDDVILSNVFNRNIYIYNVVLLSITIITSFFLSYMQKGILITDRRKICINYLQTLFFPDLLSLYPYGQNLNGEIETGYQRILLFLKLIKLFRFKHLIKTSKEKEISNKIQDYIDTQTFLNILIQFIRLFFTIITSAHWIGCFFYFLKTNDNVPEDKIEQDIDFSSMNPNEKYTICLYWAIQTMTTIGYGEIKIITMNQQLFACFVMFISSGMYGYTLNKISSIILEMASSNLQFNMYISTINKFMKKKNLPIYFQQGVKQYFDFIYQENGILGHSNQLEKNILNNLSDGLQRELILQKNSILLTQNTFFSVFTTQFYQELTMKFNEQLFGQKDFVIIEGEKKTNYLDDTIYFLMNGKIRFFNMKTDTTFNITKEQMMFGQYEYFQQTPNIVSIQTQDFCNVLLLNRGDFIRKLQSSESLKDQVILLIKDQYYQMRHQVIIDKNLGFLNMPCFCCKQDDHLINNCPLIHFKIDKLAIYSKQDTEKIEKYNFQRQNLQKEKITKFQKKNTPDSEQKNINRNIMIEAFIKNEIETYGKCYKNTIIKSQSSDIYKEVASSFHSNYSEDMIQIYEYLLYFSGFLIHNNFNKTIINKFYEDTSPILNSFQLNIIRNQYLKLNQPYRENKDKYELPEIMKPFNFDFLSVDIVKKLIQFSKTDKFQDFYQDYAQNFNKIYMIQQLSTPLMLKIRDLQKRQKLNDILNMIQKI